MHGKIARDHYIGKGGKGRLNCAQAVIAAFAERFGLSDAEVVKYMGHGGGNAPGGLCGAYAAAKDLILKHYPDKVAAFEQFFLDQAGSLSCAEIRGKRQLSCLGCVEKAADFVSGLER
ncbi:MAG: C-GCAxxG-C-C family protein [Candidatus Margulisbacteria bacterium]|jgi:hypothetical protein|nr:C-GCAxxG-C-C family protein [Candidatus Margulisiibacteriota bacterium]